MPTVPPKAVTTLRHGVACHTRLAAGFHRAEAMLRPTTYPEGLPQPAKTDIRAWRDEMRENLEGWAEPGGKARGGYLVPTEPDAARRALTRIELRAAINTLSKVLGEDPADYDDAQCRDIQRVADDAIAEHLLDRRDR